MAFAIDGSSTVILFIENIQRDHEEQSKHLRARFCHLLHVCFVLPVEKKCPAEPVSVPHVVSLFQRPLR